MQTEVDPFLLVATGTTLPTGPTAEPDAWPAIKRTIIAGLDVIAEYRALGVRFVRPTFNAKGWAECHAIDREDENPSAAVSNSGLYVDRGGAGSQMDLFDFAVKHGTQPRWIDAIKLYAERAGVTLPKIHAKSQGRIHEATYLYRDAQGETRYAVWRYKVPSGGKTFSQHPPDGKGGWKFGAGAMDGVEPLPYRLPEILASDPDEVVWIVEGEKDAERLADQGLVSTTSHGGAQNADKTWLRFDLSPFSGRDLVLLPDNDKPGRDYAATVAGLLHPIARSIRVVNLPDLPAKGDVSDWLDLGHTIDDLGHLVHVAPAYDPTAPPEMPAEPDDPSSRDATLADVRREITTDEWLWPGWIAKDVLTLIAAEGGTGKTRTIMDLCRRIYNGFPWPDGAPMPMIDNPRFLIVAADNQHRELCEIAEHYGIPDEALVLNASGSDPFGGTSLQTEEELADLEARIARVKPTLTIIDTITNTSDLKAQDSSDAKRQYKPLQEIARRCRAPIICVSHLNAGGKVLGRRATEKVRVVIQMDCPDPEGQPFRRKLWVEKTYSMRPEPLGVTMGTNGNEYDLNPPTAPTEGQRIGGATRGPAPAKTIACMEWLRGRLQLIGRMKVGQLRKEAETLDFSASVLYRAKDELSIDEEELDGRKWWSLPLDLGNNHAGEAAF